MDYQCRVCKEIGDAEETTEFKDGEVIEFKHCPHCGSDCITAVEDLIDEAQYRMEER